MYWVIFFLTLFGMIWLVFGFLAAGLFIHTNTQVSPYRLHTSGAIIMASGGPIGFLAEQSVISQSGQYRWLSLSYAERLDLFIKDQTTNLLDNRALNALQETFDLRYSK